MKLILCFAILFAIYLLDATAAPAIDDQQNEQNHIDVLSLNSMSDFDGQRHIELQRRKRHSNDRVCMNNNNSMVCALNSNLM